MCSSTPSFDSSLVLKLSGSSSTSPSRLPRMFVEYQPDRPSMRALQHRTDHRLDERLAGLEVLPRDRHVLLGRVLAHRVDVDGEVRGAVGERHALLQRGVGVQHRRGDGRVVGVDRGFEGVERHVRRAGLDEDLGRRRPEHHDPIDLLLLAEAVDVLADRLEHGALVDGADHVVGVDALGVAAVEGGRHRTHVAQCVGDALEVAAGLEHARSLGGDVGVVGERVPRAEHDVVERRRSARSP